MVKAFLCLSLPQSVLSNPFVFFHFSFLRDFLIIDQAAGPSVDLSGIDRDPWGAPYLIDENEFEWLHTSCRNDNI